MRKITLTATCIILAAYFAFTSGVVAEVTGNTHTERIDVPISVALRPEANIMGLFTDNDIKAAEWLAANDPISVVYTDLNGHTLLLGYTPECGFWEKEPNIGHDYYLFLLEWNHEHRKMAFGTSPALRWYTPSLPSNAGGTLVFRSGNAEIYKFSGGK